MRVGHGQADVSLDDPFVMLNQASCRALAKDPAMPLRFRVAFLAYGSQRKNGHAVFAKGELAKILGVCPASLSKAIGKAKDAGLLMYESNCRCLVSPKHVVTGGLGHEHDPCAIHHGKRTRPRQDLSTVEKE